MFADIVGFTKMTEELSPVETVKILNDVFSMFDEIADKHRVEKIKTIGDAYMVAGGLDEHHQTQGAAAADRDYCGAICSMATDMRDYMETLSGIRKARLQIHVGIGTGPVVAGVIGMKKFIYDLWGDTVNIAARVTEQAGPSTILVDATTYRRVRNLFEFEGPLALNVKGKGEITVYRLVAHNVRAAGAAGVRT
jgi:class 3 adenylate cyclase